MATRMQPSKARRLRGKAPAHAPFFEAFYAGGPLPCPVGCGGSADVVRSGTLRSGSGEIWVECQSCAQRQRYQVPSATPAERRRVASQLRADREPLCPRHARPTSLARRGRQLLCSSCGVVFRG